VDDKRIGNEPPARRFSDYIVEIDRDNCPAGVEIIERL
jgi:CRISPR-associated protein Csd2